MTKNSIILKWGVIGSVTYLIVGLLGHLMGLQTAGFMSYLFGIIIAFPILMASFEFRDKYNSSFATLPQIFVQGIKVTLVLAFTAVMWSYVYASFINQSYIEDKRFKDKLVLLDQGLNEAEIDEAIALADEKISPMKRIVIEKLVQAIIFGIFVSLVAGLVIRNEKPRPELIQEED